MKRIKTREQVEKSQKKNKMIVGIVLIGLMAVSSFSFIFYGFGIGVGGGFPSSDSNSGQNENQNNDGLSFNGQYWVLTSGQQQFFFANNPQRGNNVSVNVQSTLQKVLGDGVVYIDSADEDGLNQLSLNFGQFARVQRACLNECEENIPERTCEEGLIILRNSEGNSVYQEENCIFIEGDSSSIDAFLLRMLGIN